MPIDTWWLVVIYIGNGIVIAMFVISNSDDFVSIQYKHTHTHTNTHFISIRYKDTHTSDMRIHLEAK